MRSGPRTVGAENWDVGGMRGLQGRLREDKGEDTGTHGMGEEGHESAEYEALFAMKRRDRKQNEGEDWGTAVHDIKERIAVGKDRDGRFRDGAVH
eukprot:jgi/Undpi1/6857/HiC_scaffold_21.g09333.m1